MAVEPRTANSIVENLYNQAGFSDPAGKAWWSNQIASGAMSPEQATSAFKAALPAPAAPPKIDPINNIVLPQKAAFTHVNQLFQRDLNRPADQAGMDFWIQRAQEVPVNQLNAEFREAAKTENPQAGSLQTPIGRSTLLGDPGYVEPKRDNILQTIAPFIIPVVAIVAPTLLPSIGSALGATNAVAANAIGSAVVNAGVTAAQGGSASDILRAGAAGAAGGAAGTLAGQAVAGALPTDTLTGRALEAGAKGAAGAGAGTLVQTGDVGKALQAGAMGGLAGGAGELASVAGQKVLPADVSRTTQALVAGGLGGATEAVIQGQDPLTGGLLSAGYTAGATQLKDAEAARKAQQDQVISAFMQPPSPGVGTQLGDPTALATQAGLPGYTVTEFAPGTEFTPSGKELSGRFEPIVVTGEETSMPTAISPVSPTIIPSKITTPTKTGATTTQTSAAAPSGGTTRPAGAPTLTYVGSAQPEVGPPASGRQTPIAAPSGGGGATAAGGGAVSAGGGAQPSRTDQILDLTGIRQPTTPSLPEVTVTGEEELDRLPEVQVTGEEDIERLPQVDVTGEEDIDRVVSQTFPLTPKIDDTTKELINYIYGNINQSPFLFRQGQIQPGSSALAQALGVGDPGASYLGKKGKERKPVWNIESLKLKDELGGDYG